ncbi:hypothetical protein PsAD37_03364 [Pseudovibrio sp. Ad37]|nr:hypothetical protein PsAD37_03364 [Pseudovibrio sp. Ad37]
MHYVTWGNLLKRKVIFIDKFICKINLIYHEYKNTDISIIPRVVFTLNIWITFILDLRV